MFSMQLKLLFAFVCLIIDSSNESPSNEQCYFVNHDRNETWKLMWQDNFKSDDYFKQNWVIDHGNCDEWDIQSSCNIKDNVRLQNGFLVMSAKEEKYGSKNYTGARLTTNRVFGHGRYEARMALSVDEAVWSYFFTHIDALDTDNNYGIFIMHEFEKSLKSWQMAVFSKGFRIYRQNKNLDIDQSSFHLYGMEWSEDTIQFFIDDHYSEPIRHSDIRHIKQEQHIRFLQSVHQFNKPLEDKLNWKCPLWIVDYVRVYEKVGEVDENVGLKVELCENQNDVNQSSEKQREIVNLFCAYKTSQMIETFLEFLITF